jgi:hypothetical protein
MEERTREAGHATAMRHCFSVGDSAHLSAVQPNSIIGFLLRSNSTFIYQLYSYLSTSTI